MIKLLIVDDEKGLCEYLKDFFKPRGYSVFIATNGQDALSTIKKENPELVLLDINMPDMDGLEVLRQIKKISTQTKVIMVTVSDDLDTREKAKNLGADEFVKKPFTTDYLEDVVILKVSEMTKEKEPANLLIVDDEDEARERLNRILNRRFECNIFEAANGEEALNLLRTKKIDLVFLDIRMPGISGMEIIKEKKKLSYKPTIWVVTGFDSEEIAHKVIEEGADDYIPKPFFLRVLDSKVRNFLAQIGKYKPKGNADSEK
ncbi:response regulator [Candidatus Gottesmanbacteria bacterium]|nr:response regulator [Candidatus Gottesmanbacteria bacterium]